MPIFGLDHLAFAHPRYPRALAVDTLPPDWALGVFDDPFGPVIPSLREHLSRRHIPLVRIQAHWANNHEVVPLKKLRRHLPAYEMLARDFPEVRFYVSHSCEYNEKSKKAIAERIKMCQDLAPSCRVVQSAMSGSAVDNHDRIEVHGNGVCPPGGLVSMDGTNRQHMNVKDWIRRNRQAEVIFLWRDEFNMRHFNQPAPAPMARVIIPSKQEILELTSIPR